MFENFNLLRGNASLSEQEHKALAAHYFAIRWHIGQMVDLLNGKARAKWVKFLCRRYVEHPLTKIRQALQSDWYASEWYASSPATDPYDKDTYPESCCPRSTETLPRKPFGNIGFGSY